MGIPALYDNLFLTVISDDVAWCLKNLKGENVFISRGLNTTSSSFIVHDIALAAHCNHSIISYGTFSFWTAFLKLFGITIHPQGFWDMPNLSTKHTQWISQSDPCQSMSDGKVTLFNTSKCQDM